MEIITVTNNANFARVKLGEIRPNRFRDLVRWPVERSVIDGLKQSINETGFWNNLQAIRNERDEVELRFGHHRWTAGLELFGPDYEVAVEMVPFQGEWSLLRALHMENAVNRNKVMHTHEVVAQLTRWWDDEVFEKYPSWEDCERSGFFTRPLLEQYFGKDIDGMGGAGAYSKCAKYGIGREVISKMLEGTETENNIKQALASLPLTNRRKRGLELQAAENRIQAEEERKRAEQIKKEREAAQIKEAEAARVRHLEMEKAAAEKRKAEAAEKAARDEKNRQIAAEKRAQADDRMAELKKEQAAKEAAHKAEQEAQRKAALEAENNARMAEVRAQQKEKVVESREWFDARAAEVFDRPAHGAAFRMAVMNEDVRPYLRTEDLLPFAQSVRTHLERDEFAVGKELTADRIRQTVAENCRTFKQGIRQEVDRIQREEDRNSPFQRLKRKVESAHLTMWAAQEAIGSLLSEISSGQITGADLGLIGDKFDRSFNQLDTVMAEFKRLRQPR